MKRILFRIEETAKLLSLGTSTVYKIAQSNPSAGKKIGKSIRIRRTWLREQLGEGELEAWEAEMAEEGGAE